jgi:hypothetical protein
MRYFSGAMWELLDAPQTKSVSTKKDTTSEAAAKGMARLHARPSPACNFEKFAGLLNDRKPLRRIDYP